MLQACVGVGLKIKTKSNCDKKKLKRDLFFQRNRNFALRPWLEAFHLTHWGGVLHPLDHLVVVVLMVVRVVMLVSVAMVLMARG